MRQRQAAESRGRSAAPRPRMLAAKLGISKQKVGLGGDHVQREGQGRLVRHHGGPAGLGDATGKDVWTGAGDVAAGNRGLPAGGVTGQVLGKQSSTDHDAAWGAEGIYAFKPADEQRDSDPLADDTDLVFSLKGGQKYLVEAALWFWEPAADGSIQVTWTLPSLTGNATRMEHLLSFTDGAMRYEHEEATAFTVRTDSNSDAAMCQVRT